MDVDVVPLSLPRRDNGSKPLFERRLRQSGDLDRAAVYGSAALAVNCRRADDGNADSGRVRGENHLVNIAVEGLVREVKNAVDVADVVIILVGEGGLTVALVLVVVLGC